MTSVGDRLHALNGAADVQQFLAVESAAGLSGQFADLEEAVVAILSCSFTGRAPMYVRPGNAPVLTPAVPTTALTVVEATFDLAAQQARGAWWLPEQASVQWGMVNLAAYYRDQPSWAMTRAGDDHGRFPLAVPAVFATWAVLAPFADALLEPLILRGPISGSLAPDMAAARWAAVSQRYRDLALDTAEVQTAVHALTPGHGWSRLDPAGQVEAKQRLLTALGSAMGVDAVRRWRASQLHTLAARYAAKAKKGQPESRAVLVKAVQPTMAAWFGGDWLALLHYLDQQPAEAEIIQTVLPAARLYVEGSQKVQQVARERNLAPEKVASMLASYLGGDAILSPVQQRAELVRAWWDASDAAQAVQRPGMPALDSGWEAQVPLPNGPERPFAEPPGRSWLPPVTWQRISELWATKVFPTWPDRLVSTLSPTWSFKRALGPGLEFWSEIGLSCWYICEGPYARTELSELGSYYRRLLLAMQAAGTPVDGQLFVELEAAESRLGAPEQLRDPGQAIDAGHGITLTFSMSSGTRRDGYEILRDILTPYRRAWASAHLDKAVRAAWEQPLRELADKLNKAVAARGRLPTVRQRARLAASVANAWFGGDLSATFAAIGEQPPGPQSDVRMLPADRYGYCRRVYGQLGGRAATNPLGTGDSQTYPLLSLAANAPRLIQQYELFGRPPTAKEADYDKYTNWPAGPDYDAYLAACITALSEPSTLSSEPGAPMTAGPSRSDSGDASERARREQTVTPGDTGRDVVSSQPVAAASPSAAWHPDPGRQPGVLRWWDGDNWTAFIAPGPGAGPGWFTDPDTSGQHRWFDGNRWTGHVQPVEQEKEPATPDLRPPWEVEGLPCGLTSDDFNAARQIAATLTGSLTSGRHSSTPARGPWARYFQAYGTHHPYNQARLRALTARTPITHAEEGWAIYPAVFVPDPSRSGTDVRPIGAATEVGYVGSAWSSLTGAWADRVRTQLPDGHYVVTRVAVIEQDGQLSAQIWIPTLERAPWLS